MRAGGAALVAGLACTVPALLWAGGVIALEAGGGWPTASLRAGLAGLWLAQAACVAVLLPACVTLWRTGEIAAAALAFVLFPLPLLALAWLSGVCASLTIARGLAVLALGAMVAQGAGSLVHRSGRVSLAAGLVMPVLQLTLGSATWLYRDLWLGWTGL